METQERPPSSPPPCPPPFSRPPLPFADVVPPLPDASAGGVTQGAMEDPVVDPSAVDFGCDPQEGTGDSEIDPLLEVDAFPGAPEDLILHEAEASPFGPAVLSDELRDQIVRQVEYYFSDENLPTDKFLLKFVKKDKKGYVPIAVIASFRRMKKLVEDLSLVEAALGTSPQLVVSKDGKKVRRLNPLPVVATTEAKSRTILVENLPDDRSEENMQRIFGKLGKIVKITLHDPQSVDKSASNWKSGVTISSKVHALVEYETVDAAASAVRCLNDEKNWRSGMRVELLLKRMGKYGLVPKGRKATSVEKNNSAQVDEPTADREKSSLDNHEELPTTEESRVKVFEGIATKVEEEVKFDKVIMDMAMDAIPLLLPLIFQTSLYKGQGCQMERGVSHLDGVNLPFLTTSLINMMRHFETGSLSSDNVPL
ncbi:La domain [Musa troglodytarum]|uniref:La domain n=1 Tax=Musa troglodytarum TaxID=320322 RepID=A0A9E7JB16_9LILI|nr:La domain [Musa troglodytarum]